MMIESRSIFDTIRKSWFCFYLIIHFVLLLFVVWMRYYFSPMKRESDRVSLKRQDKCNLFFKIIFEYFTHSQSQIVHFYFDLSCWTLDTGHVRIPRKESILKGKDRNRAKEKKREWDGNIEGSSVHTKSKVNDYTKM